MDNTSIIKQSIDICINQIDYTEFGLKESKNTTYIVTTISIINHLLKNYVETNFVNKQNMISLLNKINIDYGRE